MHPPTPLISVDALLRPRAIALVGVSEKGGAGANILKSGERFGHAIPTWPVHPRALAIAGHRCFRSLRDLPAVPDCVIVAVPADAVLDVVAEAGEVGARAACVVAEGFADAATAQGRERQDKLVALARHTKMALAGPNCMGIGSLYYGFAATMTDIPAQAVAGGISFASQSGGLLNALAELAANRGIGVNFLISSGNEAALEMADYIAFLADDPATRVIGCIMEGVKDGRRFRAAIEAAARKKPVVVLKLGRSAFGQRATLAHTGTLAGRHEAFAALFRQNGVGLVDSIDMLAEATALFDRSPLPRGGRVVMMTVSGGATSLIGDLGEAAGLRFPPLAEATNRRIQHILGVERAFANPLDTVGLPRLRREQNLTTVLQALEQDDGVDLIGLVLGMRADGWSSHCELADQVAAAAKAASKPLMIVSFMANSLTRYWRDYGRTHALPMLEDLQRGLHAVRLLIDYAAFRSRAASRRPAVMTSAPLIAQIPLARGGILTEVQSKQILAKAGLPTTREILARSPAEAVAAAARIGGRVALKVQSPDIPHKSDIGGVCLGAATAAEIETAAQRVLENARRNCPRAAIDGVLVQELIEDGAEFLIGMTYDQQFGPLVVCGAGGIQVEVFKDVAVFLPPIDAGDVRDALGVLKAMKLLERFRGAAAKDFDALVECCVRFGAFVSATDGLFTSIDLNPVFVRPRGQGVRIADALIEMRDCSEQKHD